MTKRGERILYGVVVALGILGWLCGTIVTSTLLIWALPNWGGRVVAFFVGVGTGVWTAKTLWPYMEQW